MARVLTPHLGEMSRLTGVAPAELETRRMDACREWAMKWGCVLVLKGAPTVIAGPDGRATVNPTGNPGMATAGMGDVLTGIVAALLAQGLAPYDAARAAVYAHGLGADHCARAIGPGGFRRQRRHRGAAGRASRHCSACVTGRSSAAAWSAQDGPHHEARAVLRRVRTD